VGTSGHTTTAMRPATNPQAHGLEHQIVELEVQVASRFPMRYYYKRGRTIQRGLRYKQIYFTE
jgi:hypothetical protein